MKKEEEIKYCSDDQFAKGMERLNMERKKLQKKLITQLEQNQDSYMEGVSLGIKHSISGGYDTWLVPVGNFFAFSQALKKLTTDDLKIIGTDMQIKSWIFQANDKRQYDSNLCLIEERIN